MLLQPETVTKLLGENGCIYFNSGPTLRNRRNRRTALYCVIIFASFSNLIKYAAIANRALFVLHKLPHDFVTLQPHFLEVVVLDTALYFFLALECRLLTILKLRHAKLGAF